MLRKLLIANRGEIAVRIARTARRMGIATVAVYSDADAGALHVTACDESVRLGGPPASESYLDVGKVVAAARAAGADAVHPGYGFLSENPALADACVAAGIAFVGPPAAAMRRLGDKAEAKALAERCKVPVVPGHAGAAPSIAAFEREARRIGFPLMVKAVAGGGGRGMRVVRDAGDLPAAVESAAREAEAAFADGRLLLERLVERPRHVEVQVFADSHGNVVHMFERECSLQRRHQKVVEEAPAPAMSAGLRARLTDAAVRLAQAAGYEGAGTVEFLIEGGALAPDAPFFFIEANTRLQVEHPVTEQITGLDLVEWQLRVAAGERLPLSQAQISLVSPGVAAIELRICAEDPAHGFRPGTGRLLAFAHEAMKSETRLETGVRVRDEITAHYDSMIAKLVCRASSRDAAVAVAAAELARLRIAGPRTNIRFLSNLLHDADVRAGRMDTGLIDRKLDALVDPSISSEALLAACRALLVEREHAPKPHAADEWPGRWPGDPWARNDAFQLGPPRSATYTFNVDGEARRVLAEWAAPGPGSTGEGRSEAQPPQLRLSIAPGGADIVSRGSAPVPGSAGAPKEANAAGHFIVREGTAIVLVDGGAQVRVSWPGDDIEPLHAGQADDAVRAPITGRVAKVLVAAGDHVVQGDRIAIVEAMKMEHVLHAPRAGVVARLAVEAGDQIAEGALVAEIAEPPEKEAA